MSLTRALALGIVQGAAEFLPISSSGHLVLLQKFLGLTEPPVFFDVLVHLGTLLAVVVFFGRGLVRRFRGLRGVREIIIGTLPVAVVGLLVQPFVATIFNSLLVVGLSYLFTGALLFWSRYQTVGEKNLSSLDDRSALVVGLFQAAALLPGVSRSGATIVGGLSQGLDRQSSFKFSFYLSIPAVLGAVALQLKDLTLISLSIENLLGMVAAFAVGYVSLHLLQKILQSQKLYYFAPYCFLLGAISLTLYLIA